MSVVIETTLGDLTIDLYLTERPNACKNFLKLCKIKYYNYNLFHTISRGFIAQTGDPTGSRTGGESIFGILQGPEKRYFQGENKPRIKHTKMGLISFVGDENVMLGSQFFITLGEDLTYLDEKHCVFGEVVEGFDVLEVINEVICDGDDRPYQDVRITHTVILDDPFPDPEGLKVPSRSPSPSAERMAGGRIAPDEEIDETEGKTTEEIIELQADREAKARATILEMVGDIPDADMAPPENVLFVCKLNPVTTDEDLEIIFNRFGKIKSCEVIRDRKTGDSLQYAFIEFAERKSCEDAYFKMDNILIDDRRIHVDFSQSVSKIRWLGKGRGVSHFDDRGRKIENENEIRNKKYKDNYVSKRNENKKSTYLDNRYQEKKNNSHFKNNKTHKDKIERNDKYEKDERNKYSNKRDLERYSRSHSKERSYRDKERHRSSQNRSSLKNTDYKQEKYDKYSSSEKKSRVQQDSNSRCDRKKNVEKLRRYSSDSSDEYDKHSSRNKSIDTHKKKKSYKEKYKSKKKQNRDVSTDSEDSDVDRKKKKSKQSRRNRSSSESNSSDTLKYRKNSKRTHDSSDSNAEYKKKKKNSKKRKSSSDSDESEVERKTSKNKK